MHPATFELEQLLKNERLRKARKAVDDNGEIYSLLHGNPSWAARGPSATSRMSADGGADFRTRLPRASKTCVANRRSRFAMRIPVARGDCDDISSRPKSSAERLCDQADRLWPPRLVPGSALPRARLSMATS